MGGRVPLSRFSGTRVLAPTSGLLHSLEGMSTASFGHHHLPVPAASAALLATAATMVALFGGGALLTRHPAADSAPGDAASYHSGSQPMPACTSHVLHGTSDFPVYPVTVRPIPRRVC